VAVGVEVGRVVGTIVGVTVMQAVPPALSQKPTVQKEQVPLHSRPLQAAQQALVGVGVMVPPLVVGVAVGPVGVGTQ